MKNIKKGYRQFQAELGPEAFRRLLLTHHNGIITGWKRAGKVSRDNTKARESILEDDLAKNESLKLHNTFNVEQRVQVEEVSEPSQETAGT